MTWRTVHCSDPEGRDADDGWRDVPDPDEYTDLGESEKVLAPVPDIRQTEGMTHTAQTKTIRCGNCKGTHGSVQEVRDCHGAPAPRSHSGLEGQILSATEGSITQADVDYARQASRPQQTSGVLATDKQVAFLRSLVAERPMWAEVENLHADKIEALTKADASYWIKQALEVPKESGGTSAHRSTTEAYPSVPAGYYAIQSISGANDLDFYSVDRPTEGRWAGYVFVKQVVGGKPEFAVKGAKWRKVLEAIVASGPEEAAALYGQEIGRCGRCNRTLTDETSRQLGIGPVCREQGF